MIDKIPDLLSLQTGEWNGTTFDIIPRETFAMVCRKINEIVDAINFIMEEFPEQTHALSMAIKNNTEKIEKIDPAKTTYNVATGQMEAPTTKCPICNGTLVYDESVDEWYCDKCRLYADKDVWCALINAINKK